MIDPKIKLYKGMLLKYDKGGHIELLNITSDRHDPCWYYKWVNSETVSWLAKESTLRTLFTVDPLIDLVFEYMESEAFLNEGSFASRIEGNK